MNFLGFPSPLKRFYKFLLKRILGQFLQYELDMNQLDVQLGKGEVVLRDLELNVQVSEPGDWRMLTKGFNLVSF